MTSVQRRQSLVYGDDDDLKSVNKHRLSSQITNAPLDDTDMIALTTSFDRQIVEGHPMYYDEAEASYDKEEIPQTVGCTYDTGLDVEGIVDIIRKMRVGYLTRSVQDSLSNPKYDTKAWFLYPKPLPKFWKFEKDRRLQNKSINIEDEGILKGFFSARTSDFTEISSSDPADKIKLQYTGKYFELKHYAEEFQKTVGSSKIEIQNYEQSVASITPIAQFSKDFEQMLSILSLHSLSSLANKRIDYLLHRFDLFQQLEGRTEVRENKSVPHRDFYNVRKVDQNFLLSGCVSQRQLNEFIWEKLNLEPDRIVYQDSDGRNYKLRQIFCNGADAKCNEDASIGLKAVDDLFLEWYQVVYLPGAHLVGKEYSKSDGNESFYMIAKTFLEFDNHICGEYLAELVIKYVIQSFEKSKYQLAQLSVDFQFCDNWWYKFSDWITRWKLVSYNIRWNVRFSRCYTKLHLVNKAQSFQDYLDYVFQPLLTFEAQNDVKLQYFLSTVCSFDLASSESDDYIWKDFMDPQATEPKDWSGSGDNPPIAYYMFYIMEYTTKLNRFRKSRTQNPITLRLYAPLTKNRVSQFKKGVSITELLEALICNMLLCHSGLLQAEPLWDASPTCLYLYYLLQIPVIASPLSSVSLAHEKPRTSYGQWTTRDVTVQSTRSYTGNPFLQMQKVGLRVILSSSSVLLNSSYTMEPIIEEYSVAASIYLLNSADMCEFVRNSVITSGFEGFYKAHWNGVALTKTAFFREYIGSSDVWYDLELDTCYKHNVPTTRRLYRKDCLEREWSFIRKISSH